MKTKAKKELELGEARELLDKSQAVIFVDFAQVKTADLRNLRRELKQNGNPMFVIKKRLLGVLMKERGMESPAAEFKTSMATVFASNLESATQSIYKFFRGLEVEKKATTQKILGGYDVKAKEGIDQKRVIMIGQLPPREILLAQLMGIITAPLRSVMYVLDQKAKQSA